MQEQLIFWFDLVGTVIFAVTGAVSGVKMRLDLLGVVVFGCTVGVGGGIVRDVVIGAVPAAVLQNETYLMLCIVTGLLIFAFSSRIINHRRIILLCDAYGLCFTALGGQGLSSRYYRVRLRCTVRGGDTDVMTSGFGD